MYKNSILTNPPMRHVLFMVSLTILFFSSCKKEETDTTIPTITGLTLSSTSVENLASIQANANATDNSNLAAYKFAITSNFYFSSLSTNTKKRMNSLFLGELSGENATIPYQLQVPDSIATGNYLLTLSVVDAEGNSAEPVSATFRVTNATDQPIITLTQPALNATYNAGDTILLTGSVVDNVSVKAITVKTINADNTWTNVQNFTVSSSTQTTWQFSSSSVKILLPLTPSTYTTTVYTKDNVGNENSFVVTYTTN